MIIKAYIENTFELWLHSSPLMYSVTIYDKKKPPCSESYLPNWLIWKRRHILRTTPVTCLSNVSVARIAIKVVTRCHIQKLLQVYLSWRTTFHMQTVECGWHYMYVKHQPVKQGQTTTLGKSIHLPIQANLGYPHLDYLDYLVPILLWIFISYDQNLYSHFQNYSIEKHRQKQPYRPR